MPVFFGPSLGPRQGPEGRSFDNDPPISWEDIVVTFDTHGTELERLLPSDFSLIEPVVIARFSYATGIAWLAGRGYNTFGVMVPVRFNGRTETVEGNLLLVLWENMPEPIMTGREELGYAKIYCELPEPRKRRSETIFEASWLGFTFAKLRFRGTGEPPAATTPPRPLLHYKFIPKTGSWGEADAEYVTLTPLPQTSITVDHQESGEAELAFVEARWEDLPTQYTIVNSLAQLPQLRIREAILSRGTRANRDLSDQRVVE
jgi:hypothetical protein